MSSQTLKELFAEITIIPPVLQNAYFPALDGLRGIAILMVLALHLNFFNVPFLGFIFNGELGVLMFFVLSGFLITTLCIKEKVISNNISLKNFYIRRVLRIFPVAYLYILVIIILNIVFKLHINYISILGALLYLMNFSSYFRTYYSSWFTGHFWSLSVEEQFYIFMPVILKKKFKLFLGTILFIVFIVPGIICLQYYFVNLNNIILYAFAHYLIKFQAIAVGCFFSVLTFKYSLNNTFLKKIKPLLNIGAVYLLIYIRYNDIFCLRNVIAGCASSFLIGYIIITNLLPGRDFFYAFLTSKVLKTIGVLSYSIYIWQEIFTSKDARLPGFMVNSPYNLICIIVVSCLSYYFYEKSFLKLKSKFNRIKPVAL